MLRVLTRSPSWSTESQSRL